MEEIEIIARAVIRRNNMILLAHKKGENNTFLPGGHVNYGEYTEEALKRELLEEIGIEVKVKGFMGIIEYQYKEYNGNHHHEINFIYMVETLNKIKSRETHISFQWCEIGKLDEKTLLPDILTKLIKEYYKKGKPFHASKNSIALTRQGQ